MKHPSSIAVGIAEILSRGDIKGRIHIQIGVADKIPFSSKVVVAQTKVPVNQHILHHEIDQVCAECVHKHRYHFSGYGALRYKIVEAYRTCAVAVVAAALIAAVAYDSCDSGPDNGMIALLCGQPCLQSIVGVKTTAQRSFKFYQ